MAASNSLKTPHTHTPQCSKPNSFTAETLGVGALEGPNYWWHFSQIKLLATSITISISFTQHPARKVGTRSSQCGSKVRGRFAFPGARNPRICSISRFGKIFQQSSRENPRTDSGNSHSLLSNFLNFNHKFNRFHNDTLQA